MVSEYQFVMEGGSKDDKFTKILITHYASKGGRLNHLILKCRMFGVGVVGVRFLYANGTPVPENMQIFQNNKGENIPILTDIKIEKSIETKKKKVDENITLMPDGRVAKNNEPITYQPEDGEFVVKFRPNHVSRKHGNHRFILQLYSVKDGEVLYQTVPIDVKSKLKLHQLVQTKTCMKRKRSNILTREYEIKKLRKMVAEQAKQLNELNKRLQLIVDSETVEEESYRADLWDTENLLKIDDIKYIEFNF